MGPTRRAHIKSRSGCTYCKRRKVKCDEQRPTCFNCQRHGVPCSLSEQDTDSDLPVASSSSQRPNGQPRQSKYVPLLASTPASTPAPPAGPHPLGTTPSCSSTARVDAGTDADLLPPYPADVMALKALELMHHYSTFTADSLSVRLDVQHVWRVAFPREAYQHAFLMHALLAVAASHKAYLIPASRGVYQLLGDYYQTLASAEFRRILVDLKKDMFPATFVFSTASVLYHIALPTRSQNMQLEDPVSSLLDVLGLVRGLLTTLSPFLRETLRSEFAPIFYSVWPGEEAKSFYKHKSLENTLLPLDTWMAMQRLRLFQQSDLPSSSLDAYMGTLDILEECMDACAVGGLYVELGAVTGFFWLVSDCIVADLRAYRPNALLILAYYSTLLAVLEKTTWRIRGWAKQLMAQIDDKMREQSRFQELLQWPRHHIDAADL